MTWPAYAPVPADDDESLADYHREMDERQDEEQRRRYDDEGTERHYAEMRRLTSRRRYGKESARRKKLFARARNILAVMAKMQGSPSGALSAGMNRSGIAWGLSVHLDRDRDMVWSPRGGFRVVEFEPLPF